MRNAPKWIWRLGKSRWLHKAANTIIFLRLVEGDLEGSGVWYSSEHEALVLQPHTRSCSTLLLKDMPAVGDGEWLSSVVFSRKTWHCQNCNTKPWLSPGIGHSPTQSHPSVLSGYRVTGFSNTVLQLRMQNKHEIGCLSEKVHTCHH